MPVESPLYRVSWEDLNNAFDSAGRGYNWTSSERLQGISVHIRVDHILTDNGAMPLTAEIVESVNSDHLPIVADIVIPGTGRK